MAAKDWIPDEMSIKEKNYSLDYLTSLMTWFAYMAKLYNKEANRLKDIVEEIKSIKNYR